MPARKFLDDPVSYLAERGHTGEIEVGKRDTNMWKKTQPMLSVDQLKNIYVADGNMTLDEMAEKINAVSIEKNPNARYANFILAVAAMGRNADRTNIDDLRMRFYSYLELSQRCNMKINNLAAYLSIGMTYNKAYEQMKNAPDEIKDLLYEIQAVCGSYRESITSDGRLNPVTSIFWQKNYDGLKDRSETVNITDPLGAAKNVDDIKKKYEDILLD